MTVKEALEQADFFRAAGAGSRDVGHGIFCAILLYSL